MRDDPPLRPSHHLLEQGDEAFIAEVPELPVCAADGATYAEALADEEIVIREWLETARELGRDIPEARAASPTPRAPVAGWRVRIYSLVSRQRRIA